MGVFPLPGDLDFSPTQCEHPASPRRRFPAARLVEGESKMTGEPTSWHAFDDGKTIGTKGSEEGVIVWDDEHAAGARITLERGTKTAPFAITCGMYGWFFHTCFFPAEREAENTYAAMQVELQEIIGLLDDVVAEKEGAEGRVYDAISAFVERFPT